MGETRVDGEEQGSPCSRNDGHKCSEDFRSVTVWLLCTFTIHSHALLDFVSISQQNNTSKAIRIDSLGLGRRAVRAGAVGIGGKLGSVLKNGLSGIKPIKPCGLV